MDSGHEILAGSPEGQQKIIKTQYTQASLYHKENINLML